MRSAVVAWGNRVRVNWSRWIVDCDQVYCLGAMQVWPGQEWSRCGTCGQVIASLIWPRDIEAIEAVLCLRPDEENRNWAWPETIEDLVLENVHHGLLSKMLNVDAESLTTPGHVPLVKVVDGVVIGGVIGGQLTTASRRHAIEESNKLQQ